jgi:thiol-disulfide isomerase/thioredoxin
MLKSLIITIILAVGAGYFYQANAQQNETAEAKIIGVKMDAEWCGYCRVMNPKLDEVMPEFINESILFVKFNMTNEFTLAQSRLLANRMGLLEIFDTQQGKTGYMLLIDSASGEVLKRLDSDLSKEDLRTEIKKYL